MSSKIYIFEGPDRTGKSTQIKKIYKYLSDSVEPYRPTFILHCSAIIKKKNAELFYSDLFKRTLSQGLGDNINFILDRSWIGEYIYSPLYRGYEGSYVFSLENSYPQTIKNCCLFMFKDSVMNLISRDDGESFSNSMINRQIESEMFENAFFKTNIKDKHLIDIQNKSIDDVFKELTNYL
jgi:thymidylate kinase